jgi:hypothetical protein
MLLAVQRKRPYGMPTRRSSEPPKEIAKFKGEPPEGVKI